MCTLVTEDTFGTFVSSENLWFVVTLCTLVTQHTVGTLCTVVLLLKRAEILTEGGYRFSSVGRGP